MLTLFTTLKPFHDKHIALIQENALKSWVSLRPRCEVLLLGRDEGVDILAKKLNVRHIPDIETYKGKLPLISSLFRVAQQAARFPFLCYLNGDILLLNDFLKATRLVTKYFQSFLALGRRWDVEIKLPLGTNGKWQHKLKELVRIHGTLHGASGIDYFIFPKGIFEDIPPLVVGRAGWDNWMIFYARSHRIPVVDITYASTVIHQEHDEPGKREGSERFTDALSKSNIELAGGYRNLLTIRDADWILEKEGLRKKGLTFLTFSPLFRSFLALKRNIQRL